MGGALWRGVGELKPTGHVCLPYQKNKQKPNPAFTSPLVHLPSISSSLSRFIPPSQTHPQKWNATLMFHSSALRLYPSAGASLPLRWPVSFLSSVFVCLSRVLLFFLYKKAILSCFSASVCLSVFVRVAVSLAVWLQVESGVTQWATSSGGLRGVKPFPSLQKDLTGGVLYCCLFSLPPPASVCLFVSSVSCLSVYPPAMMWSVRLEKFSSSAFCLTKKKKKKSLSSSYLPKRCSSLTPFCLHETVHASS